MALAASLIKLDYSVEKLGSLLLLIVSFFFGDHGSFGLCSAQTASYFHHRCCRCMWRGGLVFSLLCVKIAAHSNTAVNRSRPSCLCTWKLVCAFVIAVSAFLHFHYVCACVCANYGDILPFMFLPV